MAEDFDASDMAAIRDRLGSLFDELSETMLDVDCSPIFLFSSGSERLAEVRENAVAVIDRWLAEEPDRVAHIYERLVDVLKTPSTAASLLEAVTWASHSAVSIDVFDTPSTDSRVFAATPILIPLLDESGLVSVDGLDARPWGVHVDDYAFQYHQLLRRGYRANIHYELIAKVLALSSQYDLKARLALDERRLRYRGEYVEVEEKDFWYGRSLETEDLDDLSVVGETFHGDPEGGSNWLHPYAGLSVRWTSDGRLKAVEIEEFMPPPRPDDDWVFARYLHAIRDPARKAFVHCDGAVKAFAAASYPLTQEGFRHRGKGEKYRKLFRIDGEFPAVAWSELASSWFRGNKLILEYFAAST